MREYAQKVWKYGLERGGRGTSIRFEIFVAYIPLTLDSNENNDVS